MNRYLIFRTDRIGDFLLSAVLINSIKHNKPNSHITVVCSEKNFNYIKNFHLVDEAILYPTNLIKKIPFYFKMIKEKNTCSIVCDGKKRSIYSSILNKSEVKILFTTKKIYQHIFKKFFTQIFVDSDSQSKIEEIKNVLNYLKFKFFESNLNTSKITSIKFSHIEKNLPSEKKNFIIFHFDEKWFRKKYILSYKNIEPDINTFNEFIYKIISSSNQNLIITTGNLTNKLLDQLIRYQFELIEKNIYKKSINDNLVYIFNKTNFFELEYLVSKSHTLIACHGAITHVAASLNLRIIDIIDLTEQTFFNKWSAHFRNYIKIYRSNFEKLTIDIIKNL